MDAEKKAVCVMMCMLLCYALYTGGWLQKAENKAVSIISIADETQIAAEILPAVPEESEEPTIELMPAFEPEEDFAETVYEFPDRSGIVETTISGGMTIKNMTDYSVDTAALTADGAGIILSPDEPQILIFHTHSSEAYTQAGLDRYEPSDTNRTENAQFNVIRIGDELAEIYENAGLNVIHDREVYDYPSYTGSYTRSGAAVQEILREYPSISVVIDLHRDALGDEDVVYKTMAEESGVVSSQIMMLVGTDGSGLEHPNWRHNLRLALCLQAAVTEKHPTLMRPVSLVQQRYNQQLSSGMFILEVGSSGNTLQEALAAIRMYGECTAEALAGMVETEEENP